MSPEAVERPDTITALSDVYAIGAVGYYLLTGTPVFTGRTVMDVCMKHVRAVPDPPSKRLGKPVTPGVEALILRCLAKAPKDRPPSARALMEELARCEPAQPWTSADAEAWWSAFRKPAAAGPQPAPTVVGQEGATADFSFDSDAVASPPEPPG
jgi:serine/threonine protein kinase